MKYFTLTILLFSFLFTACKKHNSSNPVDDLPPETQTGANTFGCLVNGKVFLPKGPSLSPILSCYYQYIYSPSPTGYVFQIDTKLKGSGDCELSTITIDFDSIKIFPLVTYPLQQIAKGKASGRYSYYSSCSTLGIDYRTNNIIKGELVFKKFDENARIASGTFWFNAVSPNSDTVKVTDGRFDLHYTL